MICAALPTGVYPYLLAARFGTGEAPLTLPFRAWLARTVFGT